MSIPQTNVLTTLANLFARELKIAFRQKSDAFYPMMFFLLVITLFPLAIGPDSQTLRTVSTGIVIISVVLSLLLSLDRIFRMDFEDGTLQYVILSPQSFSASIGTKLIAHWFIIGLPLTLISPLLAMMLQVPLYGLPALFCSLLIGMPTLIFIGAMGAALTVGLKKGSVLLSLLVLPLFIPVLILMASCIQAAIQQLPWHGYLLWQASLFVLAVTFTPFATAAALKVSLAQ